jgi:anti-anti-sigma factor
MDTHSLPQKSLVPEPDPFRCEIRETHDAAVNECARSKRRVTLDLRGLSFMDSTGVRMLLEAAAASRRDGFAFAVVRGNPDVMRVLEVSGILDHFVIVDDV